MILTEIDPDLLRTAIDHYRKCNGLKYICDSLFIKLFFEYKLEVEMLEQKKALRELLKTVTTNALAYVLDHTSDYGCLCNPTESWCELW